jgi:hypothetical protein
MITLKEPQCALGVGFKPPQQGKWWVTADVPHEGRFHYLCLDGSVQPYSVGMTTSFYFDTEQDALAAIEAYRKANPVPRVIAADDYRRALEAIVAAYDSLTLDALMTTRRLDDAIEAARKLLKGKADE